MAKNENSRGVRCSFCGKSQDQVSRLIAGPGAYICNECVRVCLDILSDDDDKETPSASLELPEEMPSPRDIKAVLDQYVIGQDQAKAMFGKMLKASTGKGSEE